MSSFPTLFISHGAPTMALEDNQTTRSWRALGKRFPAPRALLVISAHHHGAEPTLTANSSPETIHDFGGFAPALYQLRYQAPGSADLAEDARRLLLTAGFDGAAVDPTRGLDHGVWVPLRHMYPDADVPVVSLSVSPARNARWHFDLGRALAPLRESGVLIIGSGGLTHNLGALDWHGSPSTTAAWAIAFADWFVARLGAQAIDDLLEWEQAAPEPRRNHPTSEHLLPVFVALGAARVGFTTEVTSAIFSHGSLALHGLEFA